MAAVVLFLGVALGACSEDLSSGTGTGTVRVTLQDAPGEVEKLEVTLSEVAIHFVPAGGEADGDADEEENAEAAGDDAPADDGDDPEKAGWRTVLSAETVFDLIQLKDNPTELGLLELAPGKVTQVRLYLKEGVPAIATIDGAEIEAEAPSGKIKLVRNFDIVAGEEIAIRLDFDAEKSLKEQGNGEWKLQPTIKILDDTAVDGDGE